MKKKKDTEYSAGSGKMPVKKAGKKGGESRSKSKANAARRNGKKHIG